MSKLIFHFFVALNVRVDEMRNAVSATTRTIRYDIFTTGILQSWHCYQPHTKLPIAL